MLRLTPAMRPDPSALQVIDEIEKHGGRVIVRGVAGSGLHVLASALAERSPWTVVELRERGEMDATAALLLEASSKLADQRTRWRPESPAVVSEISKAFDEQHLALAVIVPHGWDTSNAEDGALHSRMREHLSHLATVKRFVLLAPQALEPTRLGLPPLRPVELQLPIRRIEAISFPPGPYLEAAERLGRLVGALQSSPLVWRLAVGVMALGAHDQSVAGLCQEPMGVAISNLVQELVTRLRQAPRLVEAVRRLLALRTPVPPQALAALTGLRDSELPLLTHCVGYEDPVRTSFLVRDALRRSLSLEPLTAEAHLQFAAHYRTLDGVASPLGLPSTLQLSAWIERAHHLAHAGPRGAEEWSTMQFPAPEFYWDRARSLSRVLRDYEAAATLYEECHRRFPWDDYSAHYAARNRWRAGARTKDVLDQYATAVRLAKDNPWWNQRYVSALIELERFSEARAAMAQALSHIDPDGTRSRTDPWLLENLFLPVAKAWLRAGCWHDALRTVGSLHDFFPAHPEWFQLRKDVDSAAREEWSQLRAFLSRREAPRWSKAQTFVTTLKDQFPELPVPAAGEGEAGVAVLTWSQDASLLSLEFSDEPEPTYWYGADRRTGTSADGTLLANEVSAELRGWLARVSRG